MKKFEGTRYNSKWDISTWLIIAIVAAGCAIPCFLDDGIWPTIISLAMLVFVIAAFLGIYYRIDGNKLIVYQFFIPQAYPIDRIKEIKPTKSVLSAPATSISYRIAIIFTDKKILKSSAPLIISPVRQPQFIQELISTNPNIKTDNLK